MLNANMFFIVRLVTKMASSCEKITSILDLNDDCLLATFRYLGKIGLCAVRETHPRFTSPAEKCFQLNFANEEFGVNAWKWTKQRKAGIKKLLTILAVS